jgi:hypothetical protein
MIPAPREFHTLDPLKILSQPLALKSALTADDIVKKLINKKVHNWFLSEYGPETGQNLYDTYTEKVPPPLGWKKKRKHFPLPERFRGKSKKTGSIGRNLPYQVDDRHYHFVRLHLAVKNDGSYELQSYLEPVTRGKLLDQPWITSYRKQHEHKDGDILLKGTKFDMDLAVGKPNLPLLDIEKTPHSSAGLLVVTQRPIKKLDPPPLVMSPKQTSAPYQPASPPSIKKEEKSVRSPPKSLWTRHIATIMKIARYVLSILRTAWNFIFHSDRVKETKNSPTKQSVVDDDSRPLLKDSEHASSKRKNGILEDIETPSEEGKLDESKGENGTFEDVETPFNEEKPVELDPIIHEQIIYYKSESSDSEDDFLNFF